MRRVRDLRESRGWTQTQAAQALGFPYENYKKYEKRDYIPHHLIPHFCLVMGISIEFLYTGRGAVDSNESERRGQLDRRRTTHIDVARSR